MKALAIVLIALGIVGLIYGGVSWTRREKVVDLGPVEITSEKRESLPVPPIVGAICLIGGLSLLLTQARRAPRM
jgi:uncharacterized membrane protein YidH (DUF202 family)